MLWTIISCWRDFIGDKVLRVEYRLWRCHRETRRSSFALASYGGQVEEIWKRSRGRAPPRRASSFALTSYGGQVRNWWRRCSASDLPRSICSVSICVLLSSRHISQYVACQAFGRALRESRRRFCRLAASFAASSPRRRLPPDLYKCGGSFSRRICRGFLMDGERGFMVLYVCSPELNSVATGVRTRAMRAVG